MTSMETPPHLEEARRIVASWPEWKRNMGHRLDPKLAFSKRGRPAKYPELACDPQYGRLIHLAANIVYRCHNKKSKDYANYGGRGITVWGPWRNDRSLFIRYLSGLAGWNNSSLQIDRIDNECGYCPGNLRFTSPKANSNNRRNSRSDGEGSEGTCPVCGILFMRSFRGQKRCSRKCRGLADRSSRGKGTLSECEHCRKEFSRNHRGQRFCGYACSAEGRHGA